MDKNYIKVKDNFIFLRLEIYEFFDELIGTDSLNGTEDKFEITEYIRALYNIAQENKNYDIYSKINQLHFIIADEFYNKDVEGFEINLYLMRKNYEYYLETNEERFAWDTLSYMEGILSRIFRDYRQDFNGSLIWFSKSYLALHYCIETVIKNNDIEFFKQVLKLININTKYREGEEGIDNFFLLECSFYFGILFYLKSKKIKNSNEFVEIVKEKINYSLSYNSIPRLYSLMNLYSFIKKNMILTLLKWDKYLEPKMELVGGISWSHDGGINNLNEVFLDLLDDLNTIEIELIDGHLTETKEEKIENDFLEYVSSLRVTLNKMETKNKAILVKLFDELSDKSETAYNEDIIKAPLDSAKIAKTKEIILETLKNNKLINYLNDKKIKKYECLEKSPNKECEYIGFSRLYPKSMFTNVIRGVGVAYEHNIKQLAQAQNKAVGQLFEKKLYEKSSKISSLEEAVKKIKGNKIIFLSKTMLIPRIFKEESKIRSKTNIDKKESNKYKNFIDGFYGDIPIFSINGAFEGAYILSLDDINKFVHYNFKEKDEDELLEYSTFRIRDMVDVLKNPNERKKYGLKENERNLDDKDREKQLCLNVWIEFFQRGELILKEDAKVFKVNHTDLLTEVYNEKKIK